MAGADSGEVDADAVLTALTSPPASSLLNNDTDGNARATVAITAHDATSALGATVTVNADGTFTYDPTAVPAFQALLLGDSLVDTFTYTVSDGTDVAIGTVAVIVHGKGTGTGLPATSPWSLTGLIVVLLAAGVARISHKAWRPTSASPA